MRRVGVMVGLAAGLAASPAKAADFYVDAGAAAGGDGTAGAPFQTVQAGIDAAMPGDTVVVAPGVYAEALQTQRDGADGMPIRVRATQAREVVVETSGRVLDAAHAYHEFEGIVFDGGYGTSDAVRANGADRLTLRNVEIRRSGGDCIDAGTLTGLLIEDSFIHHCVRGENGAQLDAHGLTGDSVFEVHVTGTEIGMVTGDAIQFSPPRQPWGDVTVERVVMWSGVLDEDTPALSAGTVIGENAIDTKVADGENPSLTLVDTIAYGWRGAISNQGAFNIKESVDCLIDRVTVYDSEIAFRLRGPAQVRVYNAVVSRSDVAFRLEDGLADSQIFNVTLGGDLGQLITDAGDAPTGLDIRNLLVLGELPPEATDSSNLAVGADVFVDAAGHDYRLVEGSEPTDAGAPLPQITTDRDGVDRPFGDGHDQGAYEWNDLPPPGGTGGSTSSSGTDGGSDGGTSGNGPGSASSSDGSGSSGAVGTEGMPETAGADDDDNSGCSCRTYDAPPLGLMVLLVGLPVLRRRRPSRSGPT